jgi:hypothetical protein
MCPPFAHGVKRGRAALEPARLTGSRSCGRLPLQEHVWRDPAGLAGGRAGRRDRDQPARSYAAQFSGNMPGRTGCWSTPCSRNGKTAGTCCGSSRRWQNLWRWRSPRNPRGGSCREAPRRCAAPLATARATPQPSTPRKPAGPPTALVRPLRLKYSPPSATCGVRKAERQSGGCARQMLRLLAVALRCRADADLAPVPKATRARLQALPPYDHPHPHVSPAPCSGAQAHLHTHFQSVKRSRSG